LGGDFAGLERSILVGGEKSENMIRHREFFELILARFLEGVSVDGYR
jgi:hypothetical protein